MHNRKIPQGFTLIRFVNEFSKRKGIKKSLPRTRQGLFIVGLPRFELGKTGPESVVLPLHHSPIFFDGAKIQKK